MLDADRPATLTEFLAGKLRGAPDAARLVVVFDPGARLALDAEMAVGPRAWRVMRYEGNDLAFRRDFRLDGPVLVWVTGSPRAQGAGPGEMDLSSLTDVLRQADEAWDMSLPGALAALVPRETWPAAAVEAHADILAVSLDIFVKAHAALRPFLERSAALDAHSMRALALHCLQPAIEPKDFLFKLDTPSQVLVRYITLAWAADWDEKGWALLRQQAREASRLPLGELRPWFDAPIDGLAQFLYLYRFLSGAGLPNVVNQVRGLGLLGFDPEPLQRGLSTALMLWSRDAAWRMRVVRQAEANLELGDIRRAVRLLEQSGVERVAEALALAEAPGLVYVLGARLMETAANAGQVPEALAAWLRRRPALLTSLADGNTRFARAALAMAAILDEAAYITPRLGDKVHAALDLGGLLDWYVEGGHYDLEYAHARAVMALARLESRDLRQFFQAYLDSLRKHLRAHLDRADRELARHITENWAGFLNHARLSTRVPLDLVKAPRLKPSKEACLWLIVFDGMRYDTWQRVVRPRLMQTFAFKKEKAYLCALPSWTMIARTSLLAGRPPDGWTGHRATFTADQAALAARCFGLSADEQKNKLRFYSGMESERVARRLEPTERFPYNILVFNISDDDLHKQREHVGALNENVQSALNRIMDTLAGLIRPDDTVIVSSDHGFMELDAEDATIIPDDERLQRLVEGTANPIRYRYLVGVDPPANLPAGDAFGFEYRNVQNGKFTVAIGRRWFKRQNAPNADRYAHGGLSFAEMVVPGAVIQLIVEKKIDLTFDNLPDQLTAAEGTELRAGIWLRNRGNQPAEFELVYSADTDPAPQVVSGIVAPGSRQEAPIAFKPVVHADGRITKSLRLALKYKTAAGNVKQVKREIPIQAQKRTDVVEISFGGLDDLDR